MSEGAWWSGIAPAETRVACSGARHRLRWEAGALLALDHDDIAGERALHALGGGACACADVIDAWEQHVRDLRVLVLASRGPSDPLRWQPPSIPPPGAHGAWVGATPLVAQAVTGHLVRTMPGTQPGGPAADPLVSLLTLGGSLGDRLVATVVAHWTARLAAGSVARDDRTALTAALHGRLTCAVREWLGDPQATLSTTMVDAAASGDGATGGLRRAPGDRGIDAAIPFGWLAAVWARGLAVVWGRFSVAVVEETADRLTLLTVGPDLGDPRPLVLTMDARPR